MDSIFLVIFILVLIFFVSTVLMLILLLRKTESKTSNGDFSEELSRIIGDKINSSFGESIKTLTDVANDKLGSVRKETNEDLENKKKLIDVRMADVAKTLEEVQ